MRIISLTLLFLGLAVPAWSAEVPLFVIQRSKNANEVQYHLRVDDRCQLVSSQPVRAVWHLRAEHPPTTQPLNAVEQLAYGVGRQQVDPHAVVFRLRALDAKPLKATTTSHPRTGICVASVHVDIAGHWAALERVYVQTDEQQAPPKVLYVELIGTRGADRPIRVTERLTP